ncbi:MAG: ribonuclease H-like domain-containing protein [Chitinophagales bacterium]|nr:ribonuclease H-like domain-containing protein [Chitinophagales bacterium]
MFAVVDIETTGGNPITERIIEIAIVTYDGQKIIEEYSTLVNPEQTISPFISTFTGITNRMVQDAPKFAEVAEQVLSKTAGKIFVAHNAKFDYGFIKHELKQLGIKFSRKTLDTVQLSRKTFPQYRSHSLGNICKDLNIQIDNRHRALGDAKATVKLLEKIIEKHNDNFLEELMTDDLLKLNLPKQLAPQKVEQLPEETGIVYYYDKTQQVIAIESAKNIKEHVYKTYRETQPDRYKKLLHVETADIQVEVLGNELLAILLEEDYKQHYQPKYNKIQKYYEFSFGLFASKDENGFEKLVVKVLDEAEEPILKFTSKLKAEKMLHQIVNGSRLGPIFKRIDTVLNYNERMESILAKYQYPFSSFYIIIAGRMGSEKCAIKIKSNALVGYTFYETTYIQHIQELDNLLKPIKEFNNTKKAIINYIRKYEKYIQIIPV